MSNNEEKFGEGLAKRHARELDALERGHVAKGVAEERDTPIETTQEPEIPEVTEEDIECYTVATDTQEVSEPAWKAEKRRKAQEREEADRKWKENIAQLRATLEGAPPEDVQKEVFKKLIDSDPNPDQKPKDYDHPPTK